MPDETLFGLLGKLQNTKKMNTRELKKKENLKKK